MEGRKEDKARSYVIPNTLLQLDQPPSPRIRIIDIFRRPRDPNGISNQLYSILHPGRQLLRLRVPVHVDFLRAAADDEDGDLAGFEHAGRKDVDVPYVEDAAVRYQSGGPILLREGGVDLIWWGGQPEFERLVVAFDVSIQDLRKDVLAHFADEGFDLEGRVHFTKLLDDSSGFVFGEETCDAVGNAAGGGDEGVFGFVIARFEREDGLHDPVGIFKVFPYLVKLGIFVQGDVRAGTAIKLAKSAQKFTSIFTLDLPPSSPSFFLIIL